MPLVTQFGYADESTYGTPVTTDHFLPYKSEKVKFDRPRLVSKSLWSGARAPRKENVTPSNNGAAGPVVFDLWNKQMGQLLDHCLGTAAISGPTDSKYTQTFTFGTLKGKSLTCQFNKPLHPSGTSQAFTCHGGKVASWEIAVKATDDESGIAQLTVDFDFEDVDRTTALDAVSYASGMVPFTYLGTGVTIGGSSALLQELTIKCDNKIKSNKVMNNTALKVEPYEDETREISVECLLDFSSTGHYDTFADADAADIFKQMIVTMTGPVLIGTSSYPTIAITVDEAAYDEFESFVEGPSPMMQKITAKGYFDGSASPITIAYGTADSAL